LQPACPLRWWAGGFAEAGEEGRQRQLADIAAAALKLRIKHGIINTAIGLTASFSSMMSGTTASGAFRW
jgi:hypothetical protein